MKKYTYYKKEVEEQEIDLVDLCASVLSKWRLYIILGIIGLVVGLPVGILMAKKDLPNPDNLNQSIVAQLDNYANKKALDERLNEDDRELYIMSLDPEDTYYETVLEYTVRTDNREDAILAAKYLDISNDKKHLDKLAEITGYTGYINNLKGFLTYESEVSEATEGGQGTTVFGQGMGSSSSSSAQTQTMDKETMNDLKSAVNEAINSNGSDTNDLQNIISSMNNKGQAYATLTYTVSYLNEDGMNAFIEWLNEEIEAVGKENCSDYNGFKLKKVREAIIPLRPTQVTTYQQDINAKIAERTTATDIVVETLLSKYATTVAATATTDGFTAIITADEKEEYQKYWASISDPDYEGILSKKTVVKWMIIVGVLFGIMGAGVMFIAYFAKPQTADEVMLREMYHLDILGYITDGQKEKKGLDKAFARKLAGMQPTSYEYLAKVISEKADGDIAIIKGEAERSIDSLTALLKKASKKVVCGDITTDTAVLEAAKKADSVYIATELGVTTAKQLEATLHLIEMYEISMDGIIMM